MAAQALLPDARRRSCRSIVAGPSSGRPATGPVRFYARAVAARIDHVFWVYEKGA
jgi:hypothetical protein